MPPRTIRSSRGGRVTRRTMLRRAAAGALALGGVGALAGSAVALEGDDGDITGAQDYPRATTRDHFEVHWWYGDQLTDGHTATDYDTVGEIPGWSGDDAPAEIVVPVHGWLVEKDEAPDHFATVEAALAENGYDHPVVGFSYDADSGMDDWWAATDIAERNGPKLAAFLVDYHERNPDTAIRLTGHSLGARVVAATVKALDERGDTDVVTSVALFGGAIDDDSVAMDGEYGPHIQSAVGRFDNFWKSDDDVLQYLYSTGALDAAVGEEGGEGTLPDNYTDHNVDYVPDHYSYYEPGDGCMAEVVATF